VEICAAQDEKQLLADPTMNSSVMMGHSVSLVADRWFRDGQELEMLGQTMRCIQTPGHTRGGMCYYFPKAGMLFSGDTLFQESVGRTDFPTGSSHELIQSVREKLFILPDAVRVFPGHGMMTTIQNERMFNPYAVV
jgi:glyoxylase-like metal-dependent hydrolase (beta-lactamase superfamily II)